MKQLVFLILLFLIWSCSQKFKPYDQFYVLNKVQKFDKPNVFNEDNKIFKQDSTIYFSYLSNDNKTSYLSITCIPDFAFFSNLDSNYCQSLIKFKEYDINWKKYSESEFTGLIDNSKNIWFHPPRSGKFEALEFCPFPYIQFPIFLNKSWSWKLSIGKRWFPAYSSFEGKSVVNQCSYIVRNSYILDGFKTYHIHGKCNSEFGSTFSDIIYSKKKGIIAMKFVDLYKEKYIFQRVQTKI